MYAIDAAIQAGEILTKGFGTQFKISNKAGVHNLVTEYDHKAEKCIIDLLKKAVPKSRFLAEESGETGEKHDLVWIIDPLDGTVNFAHRIPVFSVSIALESKGEIISGVVYYPLLSQVFVAEKGKGAFLNGEKIHVSSVKTIEGSVLSTGFPYNLASNPDHCIEHFIDVAKFGIPIRRLGSAAIDLAFVAAGFIDGFFEVTLSPWDCAAGVLLIEEAGGKVSHWDGAPYSLHAKKSVLATNGKIHDPLAKILQRKL